MKQILPKLLILTIIQQITAIQPRLNQNAIQKSNTIFLSESQPSQDQQGDYDLSYNLTVLDIDENLPGADITLLNDSYNKQLTSVLSNEVQNAINLAQNPSDVDEGLVLTTQTAFNSIVQGDLEYNPRFQTTAPDLDDYQNIQITGTILENSDESSLQIIGDSIIQQFNSSIQETAELVRKDPLLGLEDVGDSQLIKTDQGVFRVEYKQDRDDLVAVDVDDQLVNYSKTVEQFIKELDEAKKDLDERLDRDRDDVQDLDDVQDSDFSLLSSGQKDDVDDITEELFRAIQDYQKEKDEFMADELNLYAEQREYQELADSKAEEMERDEQRIAKALDPANGLDIDEQLIRIREEDDIMRELKMLAYDYSALGTVNSLDMDEVIVQANLAIGQQNQESRRTAVEIQQEQYIEALQPRFYDNPDDLEFTNVSDQQQLEKSLSSYYQQLDGTRDFDTVLDSKDYMTKQVLLNDYDDNIPIYSSDQKYKKMSGDTHNNQVSDEIPLTRVGAEDGAEIKTWQMIYEVRDMDDVDDFYVRANQSDNPNVVYQRYRAQQNINRVTQEVLNMETSLLQIEMDPANPVERDEDELPADLDDEGRSYIKGDAVVVLVTSYIESERDTGKVWVVPQDHGNRDDSYILISGLQRPTGLCFDVNHNFLYVTDIGYESTGYIYQYEIAWNSKGKFILKRDIYIQIYEGNTPYDCKVDEYGNLFFIDQEESTIYGIGYLDLWSGFKNQQYAIYTRNTNQLNIDTPVAMDLQDSKTIYFINNRNSMDSGLLNSARAAPEYTNSSAIDILIRSSFRGWGLAYTDNDYVFYSQSNGDVWAYDTKDQDKQHIKSTGFFKDPRGLCYGDGKVYVADYERGEVYTLDDDSDENETPKEFVKIQGAYNVFCVNADSDYAAALVVGWVILWAFI